MSHPPARPSFLTYCLLLLAAVATLGTLKPDYSSSRSSEYTEWPRGESRQRLTVTLGPAEDHLGSFNYTGDVHFELSAKFVQDIYVGEPVWALTTTTSDGETFSLGGGFPELGGDLGTEDNGDIFGDAIVRVGKLCSNDPPISEGCLPCLDGCTLTIDIDRCRLVGDHIRSSLIRIIRDDGTRFEARCEDGEDHQPCDELRGWLTVEQESLSESICPVAENEAE